MERLKTLQKFCSFVGNIAILFYIILCIISVILCIISVECNTRVVAVSKIYAATITLSAYSIKCGAEIVSNEKKFRNSFLCLSISIMVIIITALPLIF